MTKKFTLTDDHLKLLRQAYVGWEDCETGAPAIDCKRPYGNSYVAGDVAEILGWEIDDYNDLSDEEISRAMKIHEETEIALQIVLFTGRFVPGVYEQPEMYNRRKWHRVHEDNYACVHLEKSYGGTECLRCGALLQLRQ